MQPDTHAQITEILDTVNDMTLATVRPDGFPQATVVAFVHDDLTLYFGAGAGSQKGQNLAACDKVSLTVTRPYTAWEEIEGLSAAGHARRLDDPDEIARAVELYQMRFPQVADILSRDPQDAAFFRIDLSVISLIDYSGGFGHTQLIEVQGLLPSAT
jgi:nitroimidazol reductase NimA-like FMN-containing flavoprotein (pyridoxamine 5'-phosphate oxidase superfamily)